MWTVYLEGDPRGGIAFKSNITLREAGDALAELRAQGKYKRAYSVIDNTQVYVELETVLKIEDKSRVLLTYRY